MSEREKTYDRFPMGDMPRNMDGTVSASPLPSGGVETEHVDIVFDGPPSHESGRFIEVEDDKRHSIRFGEWIQRDDGYWVLRFSRALLSALPVTGGGEDRHPIQSYSYDQLFDAIACAVMVEQSGVRAVSVRALLKSLGAAPPLASKPYSHPPTPVPVIPENEGEGQRYLNTPGLHISGEENNCEQEEGA